MVKVIVIVVVLLVGLVAFAWFKDQAPTPYDLPAAAAIDPPAGAIVLPDELTAGAVLRPVLMAREPDAADAAKAELVGAWTPMRGWSGGVKRLEVRADHTWFSVEMFDSTILGQQFYIYAQVPGGLPHIKPGAAVTIRGRIKDIVSSPDPVLIPGRIELDQVTVISPPPPR